MANLGQIENCILTIEEPLKLVNLKLEFQELMLLVGTNGTGKTYILKLSWLVSTHVNMKLAANKIGMSFDEKVNIEFLFNNTYFKAKTTGNYEFNFSSGINIKFTLLDGGCTFIETTIPENIDAASPPLFLSKETRLFDAFINYMKFKKMLGIPQGFPKEEEHLNKTLDMYRIYDVVYMEQMLLRIVNKTNESILIYNKSIEAFDTTLKMKDIGVVYDSCDILLLNEEGKEVSVGTLSAGQQAMMTMIMANTF